MAAHSSNYESARTQVRRLNDEKEKIENELSALRDVLSNAGVGMSEDLVDREGYPRNDIDVYRIRHARYKICCLQNDHKDIMRRIEQLLPQAFPELPRVGMNIQPLREVNGHVDDRALNQPVPQDMNEHGNDAVMPASPPANRHVNNPLVNGHVLPDEINRHVNNAVMNGHVLPHMNRHVNAEMNGHVLPQEMNRHVNAAMNGHVLPHEMNRHVNAAMNGHVLPHEINRHVNNVAVNGHVINRNFNNAVMNGHILPHEINGHANDGAVNGQAENILMNRNAEMNGHPPQDDHLVAYRRRLFGEGINGFGPVVSEDLPLPEFAIRDNAARNIQVENNDQQRAFALIELVDERSPAYIDGLRNGDEILQFGSINHENFRDIWQMHDIVAHSVGREIPVKFRRSSQIINIMLMPRQWVRPGLLGCQIRRRMES